MIQYIVDAFAEQLFEGNPAAICVLDHWIEDDLMLKIAQENNLSDTAFTVKEKNGYRLRWFTPGGEIDLCGHATLATAFVIMNYVDKTLSNITFQTLSGELIVKKNQDLYEIQFPSYSLISIEVTKDMEKAIGFRPLEAWMGRDLVCVLQNEEQVESATPDLQKTKELPGMLLHVTAPSAVFDCVSRSFAPKFNIPEDPVCGSGHCHIAPLWAQKLKKDIIIARQASRRGGTLQCKIKNDQVELAGKAALFSIGQLFISV
ncbi:uncharacterized protein LOC113239300 [Hyposmocoma kahamanoa]|uniref:uncharacterized protein LOC113239300 n=1 Tax=Hyposmocoma kahamanoa TaxID=1477025 RepID=UPI000E6D5D04|nr:uncharacterized protein LOC113239300 [Hyposmocoma kahamanoa]